MKNIFILIILLLSLQSIGQDVNKAVDDRVKPIISTEVPPLVKIEVSKVLGEVVFDTIYIKEVTRGGNIDTLTTPGIYQLSVTGTASGVRIVYVTKNANGVYSIRVSNPLAWSGTGTWTTAVTGGRVIVSTTNTSLTYQREKIQ